MRAAELIAPFSFRLAETEIADPGAGEVQVRVHAVGICGSDLHAYSEGGIGGTPNVYPMVLGHEPAGMIAKTGAGVSGLSVGDRGALEPALYCYHCEFCQRGQHNVCSNIQFLSSPCCPGFFRERVNLPVSNFIPIPAVISMEQATLIEPLAVALHSLNLASIQPKETVAVIGAGPIGLLTIAALKGAGAGKIWAVEPLEHRGELAKNAGADVVLEPDEAVAEILAETSHRGVDCAFDCAAKQHTTNQAVRVTRNAGRVVITGIHSTPLVALDGSGMRRKELTIFNVRRSNHESEAALKFLAARIECFAPLVTHIRELDKISEAFSIANEYRDGVGKMIVRP